VGRPALIAARSCSTAIPRSAAMLSTAPRTPSDHVGPPRMVFEVTAVPRVRLASPLLSAMTPAFVTPYGTMSAGTSTPDSVLTKMIRPQPRVSMPGSTCRESRTALIRLTSM
jgi:hypothetical protein